MAIGYPIGGLLGGQTEADVAPTPPATTAFGGASTAS
jgi:hypothetical protein